MTRAFGAIGAIAGLGGVVLAAQASHAGGLDPGDARRLLIAAAMLGAHGLLLVLIAMLARTWAGALPVLAGGAIVVGLPVFAGSLVVRALLGWSVAAAPIGGALLMLGWLALAVMFLAARERPRH